MVRCEGEQNIPSEWLWAYLGTLKLSTAPRRWSGKRYPWRIPRSSTKFGLPSVAQLEHRDEFLKCVRCFAAQPDSGGAVPPAEGPRNRSWWYTDAEGSGLWYYDYFIQQTINAYLGGTFPDWCISHNINDSWVNSYLPDTNYGMSPGMTVYLHPIYAGWAIFSKPDKKLNYYSFVLGGPPVGGSPVGPFYIEAYEVWDGWNPWTVTWNNKPAKGNFIGSYYIKGFSEDRFSMHIPTDAPAVYLTNTDTARTMYIYSMNSFPEYRWPHWYA